MSGGETDRTDRAERAASPPRASRRPLLTALGAAAIVAVLAAVAVLVGSRGGGDDTASAPPRAKGRTTGSAGARLPATADLHALLALGGDRLLLGSHSGIHLSRDGGRTWRQTRFRGDAMNLARGRDGTLWAAGHDVLARSDSAGASWSTLVPRGLPSLDLHGLAVDPVGGDLYAAVAGRGLFRSRDGRSFRPVSAEVGGGVMALAVTSGGRILAGDMEMGLLVSDDAGKTWRRGLREGLMGIARDPGDPNRLLAAGRSIFRSTTGGASWRPVLPVGGRGAGPVSWADGNRAYAVTFAGVLLETADGGLNWQEVE